MLPIHSLTPFTMQDFPERTACIVWMAGCNMRCPYCHNPDIVRGRSGQLSPEAVFAFLDRRRGLLDGVVLSGGEASLYGDLPLFVEKIRERHYAIKLDTNGTRPDMVRTLVETGLVDYIALDYKAPPTKYRRLSGHKNFDLFSETLDFLCQNRTAKFEVRTTVHTALLDEEDISLMIDDLADRGYQGTYYVQNYRADNDRPTLMKLPPQPRPFCQRALTPPPNFNLSFRNF